MSLYYYQSIRNYVSFNKFNSICRIVFKYNVLFQHFHMIQLKRIINSKRSLTIVLFRWNSISNIAQRKENYKTDFIYYSNILIYYMSIQEEQKIYRFLIKLHIFQFD